MTVLTDQAIRARIECALSFWDCDGYVTYKGIAEEWIGRNLDGLHPKHISKCLFEHVASGGQIDQVTENRPEYQDWEFHYDFRVSVEGRRLYVETVLEDDRGEPTLHVVSIHDE